MKNLDKFIKDNLVYKVDSLKDLKTLIDTLKKKGVDVSHIGNVENLWCKHLSDICAYRGSMTNRLYLNKLQALPDAAKFAELKTFRPQNDALQFSKADLKTGMFVKLKRYENTDIVHMVLLGTDHGDILITKEGRWFNLSGLNECLIDCDTGIDDLSVVAVYKPKYESEYTFELSNRATLLWERKETISLTVEEAIAKLSKCKEFQNKNIEIVKDRSTQ